MNARRVGLIVVFAQLLEMAPPLQAIERDWIGHQADLIAVGVFKPRLTWPWFDGWHLGGVIRVDEVLYGKETQKQINFAFVCEWKSCQWWPPRWPSAMLEKGLWFLRRGPGGAWESSVPGLVGFDSLSQRSYWENYIRLYKR